MENLEKDLCILCRELFTKKMQSFNFEPKKRYYYECNIGKYHWSLKVDFSHLPPYELNYNLAIHEIDDMSFRGDGGNYYFNHAYDRSPEVFVEDFDTFCNKLKSKRLAERLFESSKIKLYKHLIDKVKNKLRRFK